MQKYEKFLKPPNFSYLCVHGRVRRQDFRGAEALLGLHRIPSRTGADHPLGDGRARYAGPHAHGRWQVADLSGSGTRAAGTVHRRHAPDRPDEGSGGPPAGAAHSGRRHPFGTLAAADRHSTGQLRLRRRQIPLCGSRTARHRSLPSARGAHEGLAAGRGRSPLHLAVGLRLPPFVPAHRRTARKTAGRSRAGTHGLGDQARGRGHHAPPALRRAAYPAQQFRAPQPLVQRPPHRRQKRAAAPAGPERSRFGHRLRPHARRHRAGRRHAAPAGRDGCGLPRRHGTRRAFAAAGGVGRGQDARHGRHQRLRHGHRQTRRAVRRPLRHVRFARKLLSRGRSSDLAAQAATACAATPCC